MSCRLKWKPSRMSWQMPAASLPACSKKHSQPGSPTWLPLLLIWHMLLLLLWLLWLMLCCCFCFCCCAAEFAAAVTAAAAAVAEPLLALLLLLCFSCHVYGRPSSLQALSNKAPHWYSHSSKAPPWLPVAVGQSNVAAQTCCVDATCTNCSVAALFVVDLQSCIAMLPQHFML